MTDLSIGALLTPVPLTSVRAGTYNGVPVLDIQVPTTEGVSGVVMAGRDTPFVVLSATRLLAEVPQALAGSRLERLEVRSSRPAAGQTMQVTLRLGAGAATVSGTQRAIQSLTKCLLTAKGSCLWLADYGTRLSSLIGRPAGLQLTAAASLAVQDAVAQLRKYQAPGSPLSEQILDATVEGASVEGTALNLTLRVRTADGIDTRTRVGVG